MCLILTDKTMGKYDEKRAAAQRLYTRGGMTRKEITGIVGIAEKTLRAWIDKHPEWEEQRLAQTVTRQQLLSDAYKQLSLVNQKIDDIGGIPTKELAGAKASLRKEIEMFSESPVHVYSEVCTEANSYIVKNHPQHALLIAELLLEFVHSKQQEAAHG